MKIEYKDFTLDSEEELFFVWWLEELQEVGLVDSFKRGESHLLGTNHSINFIINKKLVEKPILRKFSYAADFEIIWNEKANNILYVSPNEEIPSKDILKYAFIGKESYIDIKPTFASSKLSSSISFPIVQKVLYEKKGIFTQKIIPLGPKGLFANTFTPQKYLVTKTGKQRKINWEIKLLTDFYEGIN